MVLDGQLDSTHAYSFIVTDIPTEHKNTIEVEHFHRQRAQIRSLSSRMRQRDREFSVWSPRCRAC